jgi:hypothetical protein
MMGVMCKDGRKCYLMNGQCGDSRGTGEKWKEKKGREKMKKRKECGAKEG